LIQEFIILEVSCQVHHGLVDLPQTAYAIAVGDRMFLGMQDFDFALIL